MDHFRALYKNNSFLSPKGKRKEAHEMRAHKRSELYTSTRNISPSPCSRSSMDEQKENFQPHINSVDAEKPPTLGKNCSPPSQTPTKLTRQKAHLLKFLAWKAEKAKQAQINKISKRAPFITNTRNCSTAHNIKKSSFAPANHIFRPPAALQSLEFKVIGSNSVRLVNGKKEETYHFVATPKKKTNKLSSEACAEKFSHTKTKSIPKITNAKPISCKAQIPAPKPISCKAQIPAPKIPSNTKSQLPNNIKKITPIANNVPKPTPSTSNIKSTPVLLQPTVKQNLRSQTSTRNAVFSKPQSVLPSQKPTPSTSNINTKQNLRSQSSNRNGAFTKPKPVMHAIKRPTFKAQKKNTSSVSNALRSATGAAPTNKINGKAVLKTLAGAVKLSKQNPETPIDPNHLYPFLNIVTSTKRKSFSSKEPSANSLLAEMDNLVSPVDDATTHPADGEKFNFLRYSVVQTDDASKSEENMKDKVTDEAVHVTPAKSTEQQTPTTYLSPYVSVSRGKVGVKIEREKRNSLYMSVDKSVTEDVDTTTATARHTMAAVHYYRKQLTDEIARLNGQCDTWQQYKEANDHLVEDTGSDMINVTIGQTKLLTTKKLKQFGDLIDRCENGALGKKSLGKGDGAKAILTEDLEGFWSMVGLQIENVDKRFANLQRWRENNWKDPDEVLPKSSSSSNSNVNVNKIRKRKPYAGTSAAAPNRDLQKILKNAQAAFLRKKTANNGFDEDVILTPSKKNRQVLIKDRRSRSAAATVITVNTPKVNRKSAFDQTTPTGIMSDTSLLPHIIGFRKSMNLLKSTLLNQPSDNNKSPVVPNNCNSPLPTLSRKSILKTPGSIRRRPKSVIFNSPTLQFTMEDKVGDESPRTSEQEEEEIERIYSLRNRKIKLRDSSEIVIPK